MAQVLEATAPNPTTTALLSAASIEVSARDPQIFGRLGDWFAPGTETFINFLPGMDYRRVVDAAASLRQAGFEPVPHLAARSLAGRAELADLLARLAGEAGVRKVLAIAGDISVPRGCFGSTLDLIASGLLAEHGIASVGLAGYPEGHHTLATEALEQALQAKLSAARAQGLAPFIVTQFCFEADPILQWLAAVRRAGVQEVGCLENVPVKIGIAGPASLRALLTFAMRCGIGASMRVLLNQPQSIGRLLRDASPDPLLHDLARGLGTTDPATLPALHLFPFGGLQKTAEWRRRALA